jgi:phospholipase/carboxylesterase
VNPELLPSELVGPTGPATASVLWLHGLGASGHDFPPVVPHLGIPRDAGVRFVFPHAPMMPVTINGGFVMPAWYDILDTTLERKVDIEGVKASRDHVVHLLRHEHEEHGVPYERMVLAGFSQGGAVALYTALRMPEPLAGVMALSTYLLGEDTLADETTDAGRSRTLFAAHGTADPMVPHRGGRHAADTLAALGWEVEWHEYPMQHEVCLEEIDAIGIWLRRVLALSAPE